MKRQGYLFDKICTIENINLADKNARKGKGWRNDIIKHDLRPDDNVKLLNDLLTGAFTTSKYKTFKIYEPKERLIYKLPYYPDRIVHHAIMNIMEPIWVKTFINNTYSCIKGRGIKRAFLDVKKALKDKINTQYCLKVDIKKYYPSINHDILLDKLKRKIKDKRLINLLKNIVYSTDGIPIGNYLSQFFANIYLTDLDHKIKEQWRVKYYFRYADDMIFLAPNKEYLFDLLKDLKLELKDLKLELKPNYQIFKIEDRGLDFVGYVFYHKYIKLRKSIKLRMYKRIHYYNIGKYSDKKIRKSLFSYYGWMKLCNSINLRIKVEQQAPLRFVKPKYLKNKSVVKYRLQRKYILKNKNKKISNNNN